MKQRKLLAFEMELQGFSRKDIQSKTRYKENTLNTYFAKNGLWYKEFQSWSEKELKDVRDRIRHMLIANSLEAAQTIIRLIQSPDPSVALRASGIVLDRAGFDKNSSMFLKDDTSVDLAEQIVSRYEAAIQKNMSQ